MIADWRDFLTYAAIMAAFTCLVGSCFLLVLTKHEAIWRALSRVWTWARRTFTNAGDGCTCRDCGRWQIAVHCLSCGRTQGLTVTSTLNTDEHAKVILANFEERRRRDALAEFDELDAMWEGRH